MTELRPLLESSEHEDERAWLRAACDEAPSAASLRAAGLALGLTGVGASALAASVPAAAPAVHAAGAGGAATTTATVATASLGVLGKGLLGGAVVSFLALTTLEHTLAGSPNPPPPAKAVVTEARPPTPPTPEPRAPERAAPPPPEAPRLRTDAPVARRAAPSIPSVAPAEIPLAPAQRDFAAPSPAPSSAPAPSASLSREIALLDSARRALSRGDSSAASQALETYGAGRPSPVLAVEAAQLQVRLQLARGDRAGAAALARRTLATYPESAHVELLQKLAAEP